MKMRIALIVYVPLLTSRNLAHSRHSGLVILILVIVCELSKVALRYERADVGCSAYHLSQQIG